MRALGILLILAALGGCASRGPQILGPIPEGKHVRVGEETRREWDEKTVKEIQKARQIVYLGGGWQVMGYCTSNTVVKTTKRAMDPDSAEKGSVCKPPKIKDPDAVMNAAVFVLTKRVSTKPGKPGVWKVRFYNRSDVHLCAYASWKFIGMEADDYIYGWQYLPPKSTVERGTFRQETWNFTGEEVIFDYWGHLNTLYIRGATNTGECIGDLQSED